MSDEKQRPTVVATIGAFDGVHRGHREMLRKVVDRSKVLACSSLAVTFDPTPDIVLHPELRVTELSDRPTKQTLIRSLGIEHCWVFDFTREFSLLGPEEFL